MNPLRTTVVMKTDISGSTSRFRQLLAADLQAVLSEHRDFLARHAAEHDGRIIKGAGDGYWLEFPSVTSAAKAAIAMQEALRLAQLNRGDDRLAICVLKVKVSLFKPKWRVWRTPLPDWSRLGNWICHRSSP
jgi:class 3 adenylate cyclase